MSNYLMNKKFKIGYTIFVFILSIFTSGNFFVKSDMLNGLDELLYIKGQIEYYESRPSPFDDSDEIRKMLHIKLYNSNKIYKDGFSLLPALDKSKFISLANSSSEVFLGVIRNDETDSYYDIMSDGLSLVNKNKMISRLKLEKFISILGGILFFLYGIYELRRI